MNRRVLILLMALVGGALLYLVAGGFQNSSNTPRQEPRSQTPPQDLAIAQAKAREQAAYDEQNRARVAELARLETEREAQRQLDAKAGEARSQLEMARSPVWTQVITTNWAAYQALRDEAAHSHSRTAPCHLCDGRGSMEFCVLCEHSGKCLICQGTGHGPFNQRCPTCKGTGKCHLCRGSGKMPCPFCDDGVISLNLPIPSTTMMVAPISVPTRSLRRENATTPEQVSSTVVAASVPVIPAGPTPSPAEPTEASSLSMATQIQVSALLLLVGFVVVRKVVPGIAGFVNTRFNPWNGAAIEANHRAASHPSAEQQSFAKFVTALQTGPGGTQEGPATNGAPDATIPSEKAPSPSFAPNAKMKAMLAGIANDLQLARRFLSEISLAKDAEGRQKLLAGLSDEIAALRRKSSVPELLPIWQLSSALDGLLNQLTRKSGNVTASTLLTAAGAIDLLSALCESGFRPDLATAPTVRLLVVDDDLVSRQAVSMALKKAFNQPEVATKGDEALALAAQHRYDAIFLDVEMPGMDGFEVCSKIRETTLNQKAPVVFVTGHSDFDSREKSTRVGGQDLLAKPFLAFEVTVKALTLILRGRLQSERLVIQSGSPVRETCADKIKPSKQSSDRSIWNEDTKLPDAIASLNAEPRLSLPSGDELAEACRVETPSHVQVLKDLLNLLGQTAEQDVQRQVLGDIFLGIHSLAANAERSQLHSVLALASALEKLVKKLLDRGQTLSASSLNIAVTSLELIEELCRTRFEPDLANPSPVRILVVDDDPILRRGLSGSLQLMFGKPDTAESGEAALACAAENRFDVIFLDVLMPGIDGFAACRKIHETDLNRHTPIVFLTSLSDLPSRDEAAQAGGSGFISKPASASEIALAATTFSLRARLDKLPANNLLEGAIA